MSRKSFAGYKYEWTAPIARKGDEVSFTPHRGSEKTGQVLSVRTRYSHVGVASHTYTIMVRGEERHHHVGEDQINFVTTGRVGETT